MTRCAVYRNNNPKTRDIFPYLLDVQTELLDHIDTRVVVPLAPLAVVQGKTAKHLNPNFTIEGTTVVMLTQELAGIQKRILGEHVTHLDHHRQEILGALDFLTSGI